LLFKQIFGYFTNLVKQTKIMEPKKNPKADVSRNGSIYFSVGLALMLFITYSTINYKTYDKSDIDIGLLNMDELDDEEIPITEQIVTPPPPPPPPAAPEVIEIVEDEEEIEETVIESTETDQEEEIMEIEEVEVEEIDEDIEVPFAVIENVPIYPGCEKGNNSVKRKCMSDKIAKFVQKKFNTDLAGDLGLTGRQRINVIFKIDKKGNVIGVRSRAPHPRLEKEAARVINLLPKMKPGKQRGKAVTVPYSLPIVFQVQD
jgi:protein TonB